ncbi:MAG: HAD family hydrolase [Thermodesulfobacteriota bacterium]|nr:HAD family hydrolase [Thermodesulfobacteriota bacterium]
MARIKAVVFDWDGTIVNTMPLKINNAASMFEEIYNADAENVSLSYRKYSGVSRKELFNLIAIENMGRELSLLEFNRLSSEFTLRNTTSYKENRVFDEKNRELLQWLAARGFELFVSSSAVKEEICELAVFLDIKKYFKEMLGASGDFIKGKAHMSYIKNKYGLKTDQIMFVGDEKADMRLVGRLGVICVGIVNGNPDSALDREFADYVISDLSQLREILTVL